MKAFLKRHWNKFIAAVCAAGIVFMTVISSVSMAASGSPASWDDVSDDAIALRDAYYEYFINSTSGDFPGAFKSAKDIPIAWLTTLKDGMLAISPADDIYYYLKDGKLSIRSSGGGGHIRSGASSSGGYCRNCKKPAAECTCDNFDGDADDFTPFLSGKDLKDIAADYNSRYMPMANPEQYVYSYQSDISYISRSDNSFSFSPAASVYRFGRGWGGENWSSVYILPFLKSDVYTSGSLAYLDYYMHFYASKDDDGNTLINCDVYSLSTGLLVKSKSASWESKKSSSLCYGLFIPSYDRYFTLQTFASDFNFLADKDYLTFSVFGNFLSDFYKSFYGNLSSLHEVNFTSCITNGTFFRPWENVNDDWGYIMSSKPFELFVNQTSIDFDRISNNYIITINGDTIYDYSITNPDTDDYTDFRDYVDHDYDIPDLPDIDDPDDGGGSGGSTSGSVVVGGKVDVSGDITIKSDPININVNVNSGSSSGGSNYTGEAFDMSGYLDKLPEQSETMGDYLGTFFNYLPPELLGLIIGGVAAAILCRVLGR